MLERLVLRIMIARMPERGSNYKQSLNCRFLSTRLPAIFTQRIPSRRDHLQVVGHRKYAGDAVGAKSGQVLVRLVVYDAFQRDAAVLHDDANRLLHSQSVFLESRVPVDGAIQN